MEEGPLARGSFVAARLRHGAVNQALDVPVERLASVIGAFPEPALLESGPALASPDAGVFLPRARGWFSKPTACGGP